MKTITVVVTSHNGKRFLRRCLTALQASRLPPGWDLQVVVVDNGSTDGSDHLLRAEFGHLDLIIDPSPLGFSGANNAAREIARGEVIVFLNNDTEVDSGWLLRPIEILENDPRVAAVGSKLVFQHKYRRVEVLGPAHGGLTLSTRIFGNALDTKVRWSSRCSDPRGLPRGEARVVPAGAALFLPRPIEGLDPQGASPMLAVHAVRGSGTWAFRLEDRELRLGATFPQLKCVPEGPHELDLVQSAGGFITPDGEGGDFGAGIPDAEMNRAETLIPSICGAAFIGRRAALDAVGWFPRDYHVYYEDTHLSIELRRRGGLLVWCPSSVVRHYHTGTNREFSPFFIENVARSALTFAAHFAAPRVVGRQVLRRAQYTLAEAEGLSMARLWNQSPGLRGFVRGIPAAARAGARRVFRGEFTARQATLSRLTLDRQPYADPKSGESR